MDARLKGPASGSALFSPPEEGEPRGLRLATWSGALFAAAVSAAALAIGAAVDSPATLMSKSEYLQLQRAIVAESRLALAHCRDKSGAEKDVCKAMARSDERVKKADLQARYFGTVAAQEEARSARARAAFEVARARCGAQPGDARLACLRQAREDRNNAGGQQASGEIPLPAT